VIDERKEQSLGTVWTGHFPDLPLSSFVISRIDGQIFVNLSTQQGVYQVTFAGSEHVVNEIDQSAYPEEIPPVEIGSTGDATAQFQPAPASPQADDGSVIDLMVVYTASARQSAGGTTQIQNLINNAVAGTNLAYQNSGITQRINLVYTSETTYQESGNMEFDLIYFKTPGDGYLDEVHALRNTYSADLVSLVVNTATYCGIGYVMANVSPGFEIRVFWISKIVLLVTGLAQVGITWCAAARMKTHQLILTHGWSGWAMAYDHGLQQSMCLKCVHAPGAVFL
jgi:hypothetical protein